MIKSINQQFFNRDVVAVARDLIGASFFLHDVGGIIVETEAYAIDDAAAHSFKGQTLRNSSMFGQPGHAYVYKSYGLHWCFNIVCEKGCAVLLRALEPTRGTEVMRERRQIAILNLLCAGPGRLAQAIGIDNGHNGMNILSAPFYFGIDQTPEIVVGTRIGIRKAMSNPWRFGKKNSEYLSRKFYQEA